MCNISSLVVVGVKYYCSFSLPSLCGGNNLKIIRSYINFVSVFSDRGIIF